MDNNLTDLQFKFINNVKNQLTIDKRKRKLLQNINKYLIKSTTNIKNIVEIIELIIIMFSMFFMSLGFFSVLNIIKGINLIIGILFFIVGVVKAIIVYPIGKWLYNKLLQKILIKVKAYEKTN